MSAGEVARVRAVLHAGVDGGAPTLETISHACVKLLPITGASLVLNAQQRSQSVAGTRSTGEQGQSRTSSSPWARDR